MAVDVSTGLVAGGPPHVFNGAGIPSLHARWRADRGISLVSGRVSSWKDTVTGLDAVQATSGNRPLWTATGAGTQSRARLTFAPGRLDRLVTATIDGSSWSGLTMVAIVTGATDTYPTAAAFAFAGELRFSNMTSTIEFAGPGSALGGSHAGAWGMITGREAAAGGNVSWNMYQEGTYSAAASLPNTAFVIGGRDGSLTWNGDIAEVMIFRRTLTDSERDQIAGYAALYYGLAL